MNILTSGPITYCAGYKYQLQETAWVQTDILGVSAVVPDFVFLAPDGRLTAYKCYAWDGPSGPAIDDTHNMRPSLFHDAGYQLLRETDLDEKYKAVLDLLYRTLCIEDGMSIERADLEYEAVKLFGAKASAKRPKGLLMAGRSVWETKNY